MGQICKQGWPQNNKGHPHFLHMEQQTKVKYKTGLTGPDQAAPSTSAPAGAVLPIPGDISATQQWLQNSQTVGARQMIQGQRRLLHQWF